MKTPNNYYRNYTFVTPLEFLCSKIKRLTLLPLGFRKVVLIALFIYANQANAQQMQYVANKLSSGSKPNLTILKGNVRIKQNELFIKCDHAIFDKNTNGFKGTGNVRVKQDKMIIASDKLDYNGNKKVGKFRDNVVVNNESMNLYTEFMDFNSAENSGYFYNGGKVIDSSYTLVSERGYYYSNTENYLFLDEVFVDYPDYDVKTDTMHFYSAQNMVKLQGPSEIISDSSYIYCEQGKMYTDTDIAEFSRNAYILNGSQRIAGDRIKYNQETGQGEAFYNVSLTDSLQNIEIRGDYLLHTQSPKQSLVTKRALFIQYGSVDTLYLHADTLRTEYFDDGGYKLLKAYNHVKMFSTDMQSVSDSLSYIIPDSVIELHRDPILWSDNNQITADLIRIHIKGENNIDFMDMEGSGFIVSQEQVAYFNQIKGKDMQAFFKKNKLYLIDVPSNAESIYFPLEDEEIIGMNTSESNKMRIYIKDNSVEKIMFLSKAKARLAPLEDVLKTEMRFPKFIWYSEFRPFNQKSVFIWNEYTNLEE